MQRPCHHNNEKTKPALNIQSSPGREGPNIRAGSPFSFTFFLLVFCITFSFFVLLLTPATPYAHRHPWMGTRAGMKALFSVRHVAVGVELTPVALQLDGHQTRKKLRPGIDRPLQRSDGMIVPRHGDRRQRQTIDVSLDRLTLLALDIGLLARLLDEHLLHGDSQRSDGIGWVPEQSSRLASLSDM